MPKQYVLGLLIFFFVAASAFVIWFSMGESNKTQEIRGQAYGETGANTGGSNSGSGSSTATCNENQVNVQFRVWTGEDKPWIDGKDMKLKVGEFVDVNCFAKTGTALLQNPQMTASVTYNNKTEAVTLPNPNSAEVRKLAITKPGVYAFSCKNTSNTCSNSDQFTVAATSTACKRGGCSNQLCVDANAAATVGTCEFKPEYACYQAAECKVQTDGQCGFTPSNTLTACLADAKVTPAPTATPNATPGTYAASDLNKDGKTDIQDYVIFFNAYQQNSGL